MYINPITHPPHLFLRRVSYELLVHSYLPLPLIYHYLRMRGIRSKGEASVSGDGVLPSSTYSLY